jgi:uncharacterized protein YecT (DUF1311 family)
MIRPAAAALALFVLLSAASSAQQPRAAPQCAGAGTAIEKAICSVPRLASAEVGMNFAFRVLQRELPAGQQAALMADQQIWARAREVDCADKAAQLLAGCVFDETEARRRLLSGKGRNADPNAPRLQATFFHEVRKGEYEIAVAYPQIPNPHIAADAIFNKIAHDLVLDDEGLMREYRSSEGSGGTTALHSVSYDIAYLSPGMATIIFRHVSLGRQLPHPFAARQTLVFDFALGRPLTPEDVLFSPAQAIGPIAGLCKERLEKQAAREGWQLQPRTDLAQIVNNFQAWAPGPFALDILFDPDVVASHAAGAHECRLDYLALLKWLKPHGPLPPQ